VACPTCQLESCVCGFTTLDEDTVGQTLGRHLIPVVDHARDLYTRLGVRPYQVLLVRTSWSGGARGDGQESVVSEEPLLPTPRVHGLEDVERAQQSVGAIEQGDVRVDQISARYTEDHLRGLGAAGERIPADQSFYWEVRVVTPAGPADRRRFTLKSAPELNLTRSQWVVKLARAVEDRGRKRGEPRG
jgi:hypothetical protein